MHELNTIQNLIFKVGAILLLAGLILYIYFPLESFVLCSLGALGFSSMLLYARYEGKNVTIIRLRRQQVCGCICLLLTAIAMSMEVFSYGPFREGEWRAALVAGTVLILYTAWRIPSELEKETNKS